MPDDPRFSERARAFLDAQRAEEKPAVTQDQYRFDPAKYPSVSTLTEREQLEKQRPVPAPAPAPGNWAPPQSTAEQHQHNVEREERIKFLRDRLDGESEKLNQDFDFSIKMKS